MAIKVRGLEQEDQYPYGFYSESEIQKVYYLMPNSKEIFKLNSYCLSLGKVHELSTEGTKMLQFPFKKDHAAMSINYSEMIDLKYDAIAIFQSTIFVFTSSTDGKSIQLYFTH